MEKNRLVISYIEPDRLHQKSEKLTIAELAVILEHKYKLLQLFSESIQEALLERLATAILLNDGDAGRAMIIIEEFIKDAWREFITDEKHGIKVHRAEAAKPPRQPFIDTGDYFSNLRVRIDLK